MSIRHVLREEACGAQQSWDRIRKITGINLQVTSLRSLANHEDWQKKVQLVSCRPDLFVNGLLKRDYALHEAWSLFRDTSLGETRLRYFAPRAALSADD